MKFLDEAKIYVESGAGGRGSVSFLKTRSNPYGGPDGGNGGKGADICLYGDASLNTLIDYRFTQSFQGADGQAGSKNQRAGAAGKTLLLRVPCGTRALDEDKEHFLAEVVKDKQVSLLYPGGRGGLGNACFKSSTNRRPRKTTPPQPGIGGWIWLQMQLVADVGFVGFPNAGKSSLLRAISRATPKVGAYPFTTLYPHLGVVIKHYKEMIFADIPGLVEGASEGKGLGDRFLLHAKKCQVFGHVVSLEEENPRQAYETVRQELFNYSDDFVHKKHVIILSKSDVLSDDEIHQARALFSDLSIPIFVVSSHARYGLEHMIAKFYDLLGQDNTE